MLNKKTAIIIGLQAILIIILFWMLVFYGKDEYENYQTKQEEEIESLSRVTEKDGISVVSLSPAVQQNSGINTAIVKKMAYRDEIKSFGSVVPIDGLVEAKISLSNLHADLASYHAAKQQNQTQYDRLKALNADDKNVSDLAVQQTLALVENNKRQINKKTSEINNLKSSIKLQWGKTLVNLVLASQHAPLLKKLIARERVLVQISLPFDAPEPNKSNTVTIKPLNSGQAIQAHFVSAATAVSAIGIGKTYYYSAPAKYLRTGMRVIVAAHADTSAAIHGIIIPSSAVIWYAGVPWAYFKQGGNQFIRKPISADIEVQTGWFNQGFSADSEVVISGAQLLLSEEFKYLIKNENDD